MATLADKVRKAMQEGEPTCANCGALKSNHPYRHPFVPSHTTTLDDLAPDLARAYLDTLAERDRLRKAGDNLANAAEHGVAISDYVTAWDNARAALKQEGEG